MAIYTTWITQNFGSTDEIYQVTFEFCLDFNDDVNEYDDVKVTVTSLTAGATDDIIGIAFDVNDYTGTVFDNLSVSMIEGATSEAGVPSVVIGDEQVSDNGPLDPGFNTSGGGSAEPFDVGILVSKSGAVQITQSFSFVLSLGDAGDLDAADLLTGTDWYVRTQSTEGGGSAKTFDTVVGIPDCGGIVGPPGGGEGNTPGFWKNHPDIFLQETGVDHGFAWESVFGFDLGSLSGKFGKKLDDSTMYDALSANGGGEAALVRAATAAWSNATSDDVGYGYTDDAALAIGVIEALGLEEPQEADFPDMASYLAALSTFNAMVNTAVDDFQFDLAVIDGNADGDIDPDEVIDATVDALSDGVHDLTGLSVTELAKLFDVMNNQPSVETEDFNL